MFTVPPTNGYTQQPFLLLTTIVVFSVSVSSGMFSVAPFRTVTRQMPSFLSTPAPDSTSTTPVPSSVPFLIVTVPAVMLNALPFAAVLVAVTVLPPRSIVMDFATSTRAASVMSFRSVTVPPSPAFTAL